MKAPAHILAVLLFTACAGSGTSERPIVQDTAGTAANNENLRRLAVEDSLRDGYHMYKDRDGRPLMEGELLNGKRIGVWTSYLPSGRVHSRNVYDQGVLHGITTVFHPNGVLYYTGTMRKGRSVGEWKFYDVEGRMARTVTYDTTGVIIGGSK